ncbi:putative C2H2 finger domain protein [Aspergillus campestris IBT 28561]|uniref:C2H2 finger domain protein n=1 Tax=Aspergillus campestris (strain IBT 28561) TaxID=1392248 RepID=A0A2I1DEX5_ASPC2|nr:putative C2H2 finger domain protein [Aspergillus campestris IBT 28561]PKY08432.1 putative C2H2 finger domain protein [Aspergillus campestris IBT 28561]
MSLNVKHDPEEVSLSQSTLHNMDHISHCRHSQLAQGISNMAPRMIPDDELSSQDSFSLTSSTHQSRGTPTDLKPWGLNDVDALDSGLVSSSKPESPEVQMLSFSMSQQMMPSTVGPSDVVYHTGSEFPMGDHNDLDFSNTQDFNHHYSSLVDLSAFDNDANGQNGNQSCPSDDNLSSHSSHDDGHMAASEMWNSMVADTRNYQGHFVPGMFPTVPVSPPLTEGGNDLAVTTSCSHSGYPTFMSHEDAMLKDVTATPVGSQGINLGDPLFPLTPPLTDQDPNRTIRPSKSARRPTIQTSPSQPPAKQEPEFFPPLPVKEPLRQRAKEATDLRNPRDHPYYALPTHSDGKYYCPFANGDRPCNHPPTTQKCAYHKYLDSHLKPYRCRIPACMDAQLQFSSNACLFRHEREAHGLHGHGDNPHLCLFEGCDRSVPGFGFPRRWNLFDHMRRVHDYASSDRLSSPDASPTSGQPPKKKDNGRKRRVPGVSTGAQTMKRTRSTQSQTNPLKAVQQSSAHHGQRLQNAERNYYNCRCRLLEELSNISPQDSSMHDKVNASLQELITLGLNYRHIEASQAASHMPHGLPA